MADEFMLKALEFIKACFEDQEKQLNAIIEQNDELIQSSNAQVALLEKILEALEGR